MTYLSQTAVAFQSRTCPYLLSPFSKEVYVEEPPLDWPHEVNRVCVTLSSSKALCLSKVVNHRQLNKKYAMPSAPHSAKHNHHPHPPIPSQCNKSVAG